MHDCIGARDCSGSPLHVEDTLSTPASLLPSFFVLGSVAVAAIFIVRSRGAAASLAAARALAIAVVFQAIHFAEEWTTGFHKQFPELFEQPAMPRPIFVAFNLAWIVLWIASVPGLNVGKRFAYFAAWFLAIAGMLNGLAHPVMAVVDDGYFPGLLSSPLVAIACLWLASRLWKATA